MFASASTETIQIPAALVEGREGLTATIRKMTGREYEQAQADYARGVAMRGLPAKFQRILDVAAGKPGVKPATNEEIQAIVSDPLNGFDRLTVVQSGLIGWTVKDTACDAKAKADLDDEALEFFAREILRRTKPGLFVAPAALEETRKND